MSYYYKKKNIQKKTIDYVINLIQDLTEEGDECWNDHFYDVVSHARRMKIINISDFQLKALKKNIKMIEYFKTMGVSAQRLALQIDPSLYHKYPEKFKSKKIKKEFKHIVFPNNLGILND